MSDEDKKPADAGEIPECLRRKKDKAQEETVSVFRRSDLVEEHNTLCQEIAALQEGHGPRERSSFKSEQEAMDYIAKHKSTLKAIKEGQKAEAKRDRSSPANQAETTTEKEEDATMATKKRGSRKTAAKKTTRKTAPRRAAAASGRNSDAVEVKLLVKENPGREKTVTHMMWGKLLAHRGKLTMADVKKLGGSIGLNPAGCRNFVVTHEQRGNLKRA